MSLTLEEVEHIAKLARLELSAEDKIRYQKQLSAILNHVARLAELDTASIQPLSSMSGTESRLRPDVSRPALSPESVLANSPDQTQGQFKIPPIFE